MVKERRKHIVFPLMVHHSAAITCHAGDSDVPITVNRSQNFTRRFQFIKHFFAVGIRATVQPMNQGIHSWLSVKNVNGAQHITGLRYVDFDGIVHATAGQNLNIRSIRQARKDVRTLALAGNLTVVVFDLMPMKTVAPIHTPVGAKEASVNAGGVSGVTEFSNNHLPLVGNTIIVRVGQLPNIWW